jgi:hypothetical protein
MKNKPSLNKTMNLCNEPNLRKEAKLQTVVIKEAQEIEEALKRLI